MKVGKLPQLGTIKLLFLLWVMAMVPGHVLAQSSTDLFAQLPTAGRANEQMVNSALEAFERTSQYAGYNGTGETVDNYLRAWKNMDDATRQAVIGKLSYSDREKLQNWYEKSPVQSEAPSTSLSGAGISPLWPGAQQSSQDTFDKISALPKSNDEIGRLARTDPSQLSQGDVEALLARNMTLLEDLRRDERNGKWNPETNPVQGLLLDDILQYISPFLDPEKVAAVKNGDMSLEDFSKHVSDKMYNYVETRDDLSASSVQNIQSFFNKFNRGADALDVELNTNQLLLIEQFAGTCLMCPVFKRFFIQTTLTAFKISSGENGLAKHSINILGVFLGLWLLFQAGKIILPFGPMEKISQTLNNIVTRIFVVLIVVAMLLNIGLLWQYILLPVINTGMGLTNFYVSKSLYSDTSARYDNDVINTSENAKYLDMCVRGDYGRVGDEQKYREEFGKHKNTFKTVSGTDVLDTKTMDGLVQSGGSMTCTLMNMQMVFSTGVIVGLAQMDMPFKYNPVSLAGVDLSLPTTDSIFAWLVGLVIIVPFLICILIFGVYAIASFFRLAIAILISPVLLTLYTFPSLRSYAITGVKELINAMANLFFLGVIMALGAAMITMGLEKATAMYGGQLDLVMNVVGNMETNGYRIWLNDMTFWYLFFPAVFMIPLFGQAAALANVFIPTTPTGASSNRMGSAVGGHVSKTAIFTVPAVARNQSTAALLMGVKTIGQGLDRALNVGDAMTKKEKDTRNEQEKET